MMFCHDRLLVAVVLVSGCLALADPPPQTTAAETSSGSNPGVGEVPLPADNNWEASDPVIHEGFDQNDSAAFPLGWRSAVTGEGSPNWSIRADPSAPSPPRVLGQFGVAEFPLCVWTNTIVQDGFVEVRFKPLSGKEDQAGGVVWRYADPRNYYICRANALENNVVLYCVKDGRRTALDIVGRAGGYGVEAPVSAAQWHRLRIEFTGTRHEVFFNGRLLFTVEDATFTSAGLAGLWTKADSVTLFDDFRLGTEKRRW
jgi:hypothetical protein